VPNRVPKQTKLNILRSSLLSKLPWLVHGFSTRAGGFSHAYGKGALNLGFTQDDSKAAVERNRAAFLRELGAVSERGDGPQKAQRKAGAELWPLVTLRQVHSDVIRFVDSPVDRRNWSAMADHRDSWLAARHSDRRLPAHHSRRPQAPCRGVFHAGWRGTVKRIVEKGVGEMRRCFGSRARDLKAAIGPGIHGCCYEVGEEVREKVRVAVRVCGKLFRAVEESDPVREKYPMLFLTARAPGHSELPKKIFLDLVEANRQQLLAVGVPAKSIDVSPLCTNCRTDLLFSYRAEKGKDGTDDGRGGNPLASGPFLQKVLTWNLLYLCLVDGAGGRCRRGGGATTSATFPHSPDPSTPCWA
jgi:polyphenol oxidase